MRDCGGIFHFPAGGSGGAGQGFLSALRRTRSGKFTLERSVTIHDLKTMDRPGLLSRLLTLADVSLMRGV
jgi:tRNA pseudouridine55 synthase